MKTTILKALTGVAVLGVMAVTALQAAPAQAYEKHPYSVTHREWRQQHRIYNGISHGSLTNHETSVLEHREAGIRRAAARDRASGGKFTWRERTNIERRENNVSRDIYRQKHDRQHR